MGKRRGKGLDPDTALEIKLNGTAHRLATEYAPMASAVQELHDLADGRADLLALAAGSIIGGYLAEPGSQHPARPYAAALLILAGADCDLIVAQVDDVRAAVSARRYGTHDMTPAAGVLDKTGTRAER